jgi:prefoldin alpha subunit
MENDELQQMAAFMQYAEENLKQMEMQHQVVGQGINDLAATMITIENMDKEQPDGAGNLNVVLPVGDSGFIRTVIKKPAGYLVPVGARYFVEANRESSIKILESQKEKMLATLGAIEQRMKQLTDQAEKIRPVLEQQMQAMKSGGDSAAQSPRKINTDEL